MLLIIGDKINVYFSGDTLNYGGVVPSLDGTAKYGDKVDNFCLIENGVFDLVDVTKKDNVVFFKSKFRGFYCLNKNGGITKIDFENNLSTEDLVGITDVDLIAGSINIIICKGTLNGERGVYGLGLSDDLGTKLGVPDIKVGDWVKIDGYLPSQVNFEDIIKVGIEMFGPCYFLDKSGVIYLGGLNNLIGVNKSSGLTGTFKKVNDFVVEEPICGPDTSFLLKLKNGDFFGTNLDDILFQDDILQKNWTLVATNVKYFNGKCSGNEGIAYIDKNNDIWVAGTNSWVLGMNTSSIESQNNFIKLKDVLKGTDVYEHIDGKVKDYAFGVKKMYILTDENDDNGLYVSGEVLSSSWAVYSYLGVEQDCPKPYRLMEDCVDIVADQQETIALVKKNDKYGIWYWGCADGGCIPGRTRVPVVWSKNSLLENADGVDLWSISYDKSYIGYYSNGDYHLLTCGRNMPGSENGGPNGLNKSVADFTEVKLIEDDYIENFCSGTVAKSFLFQTSKNKIFGIGLAKLMGDGVTDDSTKNEFVDLTIDLGSENILDVDGGSGWYLITTNGGRVFGIGNNQFGILGRWNGVSRGDSNSRYKTSFQWSECTELEI